jgi:hypothetical protein
MLNKNDVDFVINVYEQKNIVTRDDCLNLDSRPYAREMCEELHRRGYEEASIIESHLPGYFDYSSAIFNTNELTYYEADKYMIDNVLH